MCVGITGRAFEDRDGSESVPDSVGLASYQVMLMLPRTLRFEDHGMNMSEGLRIPPSTRQAVRVSDSGWELSSWV